MFKGKFVVWRVEGLVTYTAELPGGRRKKMPMSMDVLGVRFGMEFAADQARIRWSQLPHAEEVEITGTFRARILQSQSGIQIEGVENSVVSAILLHFEESRKAAGQ